MAHKGTPASAKATSKKPTTKSKPKTTKKPAANATSAKRSTSNSRRSTGTRPAKQQSAREPMDPKLKNDMVMIITSLVCIILFFSNLGFGGGVGKAFSSIFFGLFGIAAFTFPFILFFVVAFSIANKGNRKSITKMIGFVLFFIFVCALLHRLTVGYQPDVKIADLYSVSAFDRSGGGLFGGLVVLALGKAFGKWICLIIIIFGLILFACMMTQRALVSDAKEKGAIFTKFVNARRERARERIPFDDMDSFNDFDDDDYDYEDELYFDYEKERTSDQRSKRHAAENPARKTVQKPDNLEYHQQHIDDIINMLDKREADQKKTDQKKTASDPLAGSVPAVEFPVAEETSDVKADSPEENAASEKPKRKRKNPRSSKSEIAINVEDISEQIEEKEQQISVIPYQLPSAQLLKRGSGIPRGDSSKYLKETAIKLEQVLRDFGVNVQVTDVSCGPSVTRFELKPEQGVKVSRIVNLADDIKLNLAASNIRIEAPIPGKAAVGIEVPNKTVAPVLLRDLIETPEFQNHSSRIAFAVGKDIAGKTVVTDIAKMPHLLVAGATGSGKSVCINTLIMSILYKASPDEVKLLMIDPKVVELSVYNGIPHLAIPVVTDPKKAAGALNWAVAEMTDRYNKFAEFGVRDVAGYNARVDFVNLDPDVPLEQKPKRLPQIVIIVDELADLMMVAPGEVEDAIVRLTQLARAAGIHLIIATQRPSVNVVTGLIKANMPSRIALAVASGVDSRTILDMNGAEKLLGHGDMLFYPQGYTQPARVQGGYVSDEEIADVVKYLTDAHGEAQYDSSIQDKINSSSAGGGSAAKGGGSDQDELFIDAATLIIDKDKASIGMLQRAFKIGFNRAARIMDQLCEAGVVGEEEGTKPRRVLMSREQFENYLEEGRL